MDYMCNKAEAGRNVCVPQIWAGGCLNDFHLCKNNVSPPPSAPLSLRIPPFNPLPPASPSPPSHPPGWGMRDAGQYGWNGPCHELPKDTKWCEKKKDRGSCERNKLVKKVWEKCKKTCYSDFFKCYFMYPTDVSPSPPPSPPYPPPLPP